MTTLDERSEAGVTLGADPDRVEARKRLEARRGFMSDAVAYVVINGLVDVLYGVLDPRVRRTH